MRALKGWQVNFKIANPVCLVLYSLHCAISQSLSMICTTSKSVAVIISTSFYKSDTEARIKIRSSDSINWARQTREEGASSYHSDAWSPKGLQPTPTECGAAIWGSTLRPAVKIQMSCWTQQTRPRRQKPRDCQRTSLGPYPMLM